MGGIYYWNIVAAETGTVAATATSNATEQQQQQRDRHYKRRNQQQAVLLCKRGEHLEPRRQQQHLRPQHHHHHCHQRHQPKWQHNQDQQRQWQQQQQQSARQKLAPRTTLWTAATAYADERNPMRDWFRGQVGLPFVATSTSNIKCLRKRLMLSDRRSIGRSLVDTAACRAAVDHEATVITTNKVLLRSGT